MRAQLKKALNGLIPNNAPPRYGIQSKAVSKYTEFIENLFSGHPEILICLGVEALSK
jgi:hypothetical protein